MLVALRVRQFVLIEELELRFEPGFNVLTGETGSGKSILVDALGVVFGQRVSSDVVRAGADEAEVEALFDISASASLPKRLEQSGFGGDAELVIRRVLHRSGRTRAYVNGRLCSARELAELTRELADVTSQHESVALVDPRTHLDYLDRFAQGTVEEDRTVLSRVVDALVDIEAEIGSLRARERDRADREGFLRYQLEAIEALAPEAGEHERLSEELGRLKHGEKLRATATRVVRFLEGEDGGIADELGRLASDLGSAAAIDERLREAAGEAEDCWNRLNDVAQWLGDYLERLEVDPTRLDEVQSRLFALEKLARQHGPTLDDVLATRERLRSELEAFASADARLPELEARRSAELSRAAVVAKRLTRARRDAAKKLGKAVAAELGELGMSGASVSVDVSPRMPKDGELVVDGARLARSGVDRVELLLAPNPGGEPRPLGDIASGGELSRVLLALRRALAQSGPSERSAGLVVLDEIDSGVGGETADRIGRAIASIACERQVLCITHLANIAAYADAHFVVTKTSSATTTTSDAGRVDGPTRVAELARMLTGARTGSTERAARDLLTAARRTRGRAPRAA